MSRQPKRTTKKANEGILSRTKLYGFELFMAAVGLLATAFVVDYGIFSLFRHFSRDIESYQSSDRVIIFLVAAIIVWLPVATFFYLRTKGELQSSPRHTETGVHKVLVSIYMVVNTIVVIGALFYAVYAALELAVGTNSHSSPFMRQIIPGALMAVWHAWLLFAFTASRFATRRVFPVGYVLVTVTVVCLLFAITVGAIRSEALDQERESDLASIQTAINRSYYDEKSLPLSLENVEVPELNNSIDEYTYRVTGSNQYELCTQFINESPRVQSEYGDEFYNDASYRTYPIWSEHSSGQHCYKVRPTSNFQYNGSVELETPSSSEMRSE